MRDEGVADVPVNDAANLMLDILENSKDGNRTPFTSLQKFRAKKRV